MSFITAMKKANNGVAHPVNIPSDIVSFLSRGRGYGDIIIKDNFNGGVFSLVGTAPDAINVPGSVWAEVGGGLFQRGLGQATLLFSAASWALIDGGVSDFSIISSLDANGFGGAGHRGHVIRYTDTSNYWLVSISNNGSSFAITERIGGVSTTRASATVSPAIGAAETVDINITASGQTISAALIDAAGNRYDISYGLATFQQNETKLGMFSRTTVDKWNSYQVNKV